MDNKYLQIFLYIVIIIFALLKFLLNMNLSDAISYSVTTCLFIALIYERIIWRYNLLEKTPRLKKNYKAVIKYQYDGKHKSKEVDLIIHQNLHFVRVEMKSNESFSKSIIASVYLDNGIWYLTYTYINEPNQKVRNRSAIHYGTCKLNLNDINNIKGEYFTDRSSCGDIELYEK